MTQPAPLPTITPDTVLPTLLVGTIGLISKLSPPHFYQSFSATNNGSSSTMRWSDLSSARDLVRDEPLYGSDDMIPASSR
jgi:hypothetical protein